jgi:hypothetical protein
MTGMIEYLALARSPIVTVLGVVGVVCLSPDAMGGYRGGGPNPLLLANLPGWMLSNSVTV